MKATITNFGPFAAPAVFELDLTLPVSEVRGYNGAGKSTLLTALRRALGDDSAVPTRTRGSSGPAEFILESSGQSITLRLGANFSKKTPAALSAFPVQLATKDSSQLEALVGPDDQSESASDTARARRLVALASIARIEPTPQNLAFMASDLDVSLTGWKKDSIADIRLELYSRLVAKAKEHTATADIHAGGVKALESQMASLPAVNPGISEADARTARDAAQRLYYQVQASHAGRLDMERKIEALKSAGPAPAWSQDMFRALSGMVGALNEDPISADFDSLAKSFAAFGAGMHAAQQAVTAYRAQQAILEAPVTGPTAEDVEAARTALTSAETRLTHATGYATRTTLTVQFTTAQDAEKVARAAAKKYEAAAKAIPARLATLIQRAGLVDISVDDDEGEIVVQVGGQWFPYALRSRSERVTAAILLVASQVLPIAGKLSLILVPDTLWTSLDTSHRETLEIQLEAYASNCHILTEAPTMDGLEVSHPLG